MRTQEEKRDAVAGVLDELGRALSDLPFECDKALADVLIAAGGGPLPSSPESSLQNFLWLMTNSLGEIDPYRSLGSGGCEYADAFYRDLRIVLMEYVSQLELATIEPEALARLRRDLVITQPTPWESEGAIRDRDLKRIEEGAAFEAKAARALTDFLDAVAGGDMPSEPEQTLDRLLWVLSSHRCIVASYEERRLNNELKMLKDDNFSREGIEAVKEQWYGSAEQCVADICAALRVYFSRMECLEPALA